MRVVVFGIDGATFDIILPMVKNNELKYLSRFINYGSYGYLKSVFPPITFPAWTSFKTGKNPGKHGVFGFMESSYIYEKARIVTSKSIREPTLWQILSYKGYKVGVLNMPASYPPEKVNGVFVSGLGTPSIHSEFTYPKEIKNILIKDFNYKFDWVPYEKGKEEELVKELKDATEILGDVSCYIIDKYKFDFFMVVFMAADVIQHAFWGYRDSNHPLYDPKLAKYGKKIEYIYKIIDNQIGKILKCINGNPDIFIVSDHGFGPMLKEVYMDEFLESVGLLTWEKNTEKTYNLKWKIYSKILSLRRKYDIFRYILSKIPQKTKDNISKKFMKKIDIARTKAYSGGYFGRIYININNKNTNLDEYNKLVNKLIRLFNNWKDPETGEKIVDRIYRKEEIYWGKYTDLAPDLTLVMKNFAYVDFPGYREGKIYYPPRQGGTHRLYGIFIAYGHNIRKGKIENINIYDLMPTILHMFNIPIPKDVDGRILTDIFKENTEYILRDPVFVDEKTYKLLKEKEIIKSKLRNKKLKI